MQEGRPGRVGSLPRSPFVWLGPWAFDLGLCRPFTGFFPWGFVFSPVSSPRAPEPPSDFVRNRSGVVQRLVCVKPLWASHTFCPSNHRLVFRRIFRAPSFGWDSWRVPLRKACAFDLLEVGPTVTSQVGVGAAAVELIAGSPSEIRRFFRFGTVMASYPVEGLDPLGASH